MFEIPLPEDADTPRKPQQGVQAGMGAASRGGDVSAGGVGWLRGTPRGFHGALSVSKRLASCLAHLGLTAGFRLDGTLAAWATNVSQSQTAETCCLVPGPSRTPRATATRRGLLILGISTPSHEHLFALQGGDTRI